MRCRDCPEGRRFAKGSVECILYGMIIREEHECTLEGGKRHDRDEDHGESGEGKAEIQKDGSGTAGAVPGILPEPGEREGLPGMEGTEKRTA